MNSTWAASAVFLPAISSLFTSLPFPPPLALSLTLPLPPSFSFPCSQPLSRCSSLPHIPPTVIRKASPARHFCNTRRAVSHLQRTRV